MIEFLFLDLDGTLLNDAKQVTHGNRAALERVLEKKVARRVLYFLETGAAVDVSIPGQPAIDAMLSVMGMNDPMISNLLGMIKEYKDANAEISVAVKATLGNTNKDFQAAVIDFNQLKASGVTEKKEILAPSAILDTSVVSPPGICLVSNAPSGFDTCCTGETL